MTTSEYVFTDTKHASELERLQAIEQVFDPATQRRIRSTGMSAGWRCLEVGAGAGSVTRWLAAIAGENGYVVAVDLETRFLSSLKQPNIQVLKADIQQLELAPHTFDLIHARYVLIHIPDFRLALATMLKVLKPGGWLVLEEPDFAAARAIAGAGCDSVNRVNQAILQMFADRGMDAALGVKLPALLQEFGVQPHIVENDAPLSNGDAGIATVMAMSTLQLAEKYIATGKATRDDVQQYCQFATDRHAWAIYYATVGTIAQKPFDAE